MYLDISIKDLLTYYRKEFPNASITIKLHLLEEHVLQFISKWRIGLGIYGEQGGESIHPEFNGLRSTYASVKPATKRLRVMLEQHHMKVQPVVKGLLPTVKKRKLQQHES